MTNITNYFVEIHPGVELDGRIAEKKKEIIDFLGDKVVDDPKQARFLRDSPHFTLMCARTGDMDSFRSTLRDIARNQSRLAYRIIRVEDNPTPDGLVEVRTVVDNKDQERFRELHMKVMEASRAYNTAGLYERFQIDFTGEALENIQYCGFPNARKLFRPHASIGRVSHQLREAIVPLMQGFDPCGTYTSGDVLVWALPFEKDDPTATPRLLEVIALAKDL